MSVAGWDDPEEAIEVGTVRPPSRQWLLIWKYSDTAVWITDSPDEKRFAIPLTKVPDNIKYLKMQIDPKRLVIIPIAKGRIGTVSSHDKFGWEESNQVVEGGCQLGIFNKAIIIGHDGPA